MYPGRTASLPRRAGWSCSAEVDQQIVVRAVATLGREPGDASPDVVMQPGEKHAVGSASVAVVQGADLVEDGLPLVRGSRGDVRLRGHQTEQAVAVQLLPVLEHSVIADSEEARVRYR